MYVHTYIHTGSRECAHITAIHTYHAYMRPTHMINTYLYRPTVSRGCGCSILAAICTRQVRICTYCFLAAICLASLLQDSKQTYIHNCTSLLQYVQPGSNITSGPRRHISCSILAAICTYWYIHIYVYTYIRTGYVHIAAKKQEAYTRTTTNFLHIYVYIHTYIQDLYILQPRSDMYYIYTLRIYKNIYA